MTITLTERLELRRFSPSDAEGLMGYLETPGASCFASMKVSSIEEAQIELQKRMASDDYFAIVERQSGQLIGEVFGNTEEPDTFSIAWQVNPMFSGRGYALEAAQSLMDQLFEHRGIRRIYAYVETDNLPSQKLCRRLGMRLEGEFKEFISFENNEDGTPLYVDTQQFAILKKEWKTQG